MTGVPLPIRVVAGDELGQLKGEAQSGMPRLASFARCESLPSLTKINRSHAVVQSSRADRLGDLQIVAKW